MPTATLGAMLEDAGFHGPEAWGKLTRVYVNRVLSHKRDKEGRVKRPTAKAAEINMEDHLRRSFLKIGTPLHLIERKLREFLAQQITQTEVVKQAKRKKRRR